MLHCGMLRYASRHVMSPFRSTSAIIFLLSFHFPISSTTRAYCIYAGPLVAKLHLLLPPHLLVLRHLTCLDVGQAVPGLHPWLERDVMEGHQTGDEDQEQDAGEEEVGVPDNSTGESCAYISYLWGVSRKSSSEQKGRERTCKF